VKEATVKSKTLSTTTARNVIWNFGGFLISLSITFVTIPIFISLLGEDDYGLFVLFQSIMASFNLIGLGFGPATVKYVSESIGQEDYSKANRFINTTLCFNLFIGVVGAIVIAVLAGPIAQNIFKIPIESQMVFRKCFFWVAVGWFVSQIRITLSGVPAAFQNFKIVAIGTSLSTGLLAILGLGVLYAGGNLVNLIQANVAALTISVIGWWFFVCYVFPQLKIRINIDWSLFKKTITYGAWQTLAGFGGMMYHWVDRVIVGIFLPPAAIGYYNVPVTICSGAHAGLGQIGAVFLPLVSHLQGRNDKAMIYKYFVNGTWVMGVLSAACYIPLALFSKSFLSLWVGFEFAAKSSDLFLIIIFAYMVLSTSVIRYNLMAGIGKPNWIALGTILSGTIGLLLMIILIPKFGLMGAGWSYFACLFSGTVTTILVKKKYFYQNSWIEILYATYGPTIVGIVVFFLGFNRLSAVSISTWTSLAAWLIAMMLATFAILLFIDFILFPDEKRIKLLLQIVKNSMRV
jgi:O-antigen/teichoic acid export membrane protein